MTGIRTIEGICLQSIRNEFGESPAKLLNEHAAKYEKKGLTAFEDGTIRLTREGKLWADGIAAGLFFEKLYLLPEFAELFFQIADQFCYHQEDHHQEDERKPDILI